MAIVKLSVECEVPELSLRGHSLFVETTPDDHLWTIALSNRAIVTVPQKKVLMARSYTDGRGLNATGLLALFKRIGL